MAAFWVTVGLLVAGALLLLLPPLLRRGARAPGVSRKATNVTVYRDQLRELEQDLAAGVLSREGYEEAKREIELRLLEDVGDAAGDAREGGAAGRNAAVIVGAAIPVIAFMLYFTVGNFQVLVTGVAGARTQEAHSVTEEQIREMAGRLAARMEKEPENVEGWIMLARTYNVLGRFDAAARAYANAVARSGSNAVLLADYADALAMAQGRRLEGEPEKIIQRALTIDPRNVKALALAGTAAFERRDYAGAVGYWERILQVAPDDSEIAQSVRASITEATNLAKQPGAGAAPVARAKGASAGDKPQAAGGAVSGVVQIEPALAARVAPTDTLFVFARAEDGPRMPIAILRAQAKDLPLKFTLDDRSAMSSGVALSSQKRVIVGARISKTGSANPQPGDLEGLSAPVDVGSTSIAVVINAETK
ncbi:MAG: c-type cytochrome biogenesis protein CcmI [Betaproteobacteria bacterium RIFCSPLOWO2_12_FULL_62_13]|nr:MAG: c-type cytochrome biogenesis protein CcmI [Betaproteobacteria bacterium RIFCSPLOWO2_12_FULL_62_13]